MTPSYDQGMFAKIFAQIFDSSIAEDHQTRHIFMDLLVLADSEGVVDMTMEALARRTNVPIDIVSKALELLASPDEKSRAKGSEGRRIELVDPPRQWGWKIINYGHYRGVVDEDSRRSYFREYRRKQRKGVHNGSQRFTQGEGEADVEEDVEGKGKGRRSKKQVQGELMADLPYQSEAFQTAWETWERSRTENRKPIKPTARKLQFGQLLKMGESRAIAALLHSATNGYQGIFEPKPDQNGTAAAHAAPESAQSPPPCPDWRERAERLTGRAHTLPWSSHARADSGLREKIEADMAGRVL